MPHTVEGDLEYGLTVGDEVQKHFVIREPTTGDLFAAEEEAPVERGLAYRGAMIARTLVRLGDQDGPFTLAAIKKLHIVDFNILVDAQRKAEDLGKAPSGSRE